MLPYHLRPPIYGGKLKRQKEDNGDDDNAINPYAHGGPVQRAIQLDLLQLRGDFEEQIQQVTNSEGHSTDGSAFAVVKRIFADAKVALLHTRFAPSRCDASAYAQLLYASCLSLLQDAFRQTDDASGVSLVHASYAVFSLYVLYETNPLPSGPLPDDDNVNPRANLRFLSTGLQNRENPKLVYRRAFRGPIRIDQMHYSYLLRLRDVALASMSECEAHRQRALVQPEPWTCDCAVARDTIQVIDRLWKKLDLCDYTGPCSLEGLAGHADYPFPITEQAWSAVQASTTAPTADDPATAAETTASEPFVFSNDLESQLQEYMSTRRAIQLPAQQANMSQQSKRLRSALEPIFRGEARSDPLKQLSKHLENGDALSANPRTLRRVTFGSVMVDGSGASQRRPREEDNEPTDVNVHAASGDATMELTEEETQQVASVLPSYELVLPTDLPTAVQENIQSAIETVLDRDSSLLLLPSKADDTTSQALTQDISTLASQDTTSVATGVGRGALQALLSQAVGGGGPSTATQRRVDIFFDTEAETTLTDKMGTKEGDASLDLSDMSEDEEDAVSVAASTMGMAALDNLLTAGALGSTDNRKAKAKMNKTKGASKKRRPRAEDAIELESESEEESSSESEDDDDQQSRGRWALDSLMARASASSEHDL